MNPALQHLSPHLLRPYWRNPRKNDAAVEVVKRSILDYGFQQPILVDKDSVIITGHTRWRAAIALKLETVPVLMSDLSAERASAYRIVDNKTAEFAEWDLNALIPELRTQGDLSSLQIYFNDQDLDALLKGAAGMQGEHPTNAAIASLTQRSNDRFHSVDGAAQAQEIVDVPCPHCGNVIGVSKGLLDGIVQAQSLERAARERKEAGEKQSA